MARGGYVQHFGVGSGANAVEVGGTGGDGAQVGGTDQVTGDGTTLADFLPKDAKERLLANTLNRLGYGSTGQPADNSRGGIDLMNRAKELSPQYQELLGIDPNATQAQMLFDISRSALNYAGNVDAKGQPLRGSQMARLAGATSELPGQIAARVGEQQKQSQAIRAAALQGAETQTSQAEERRLARNKEEDALALQLLKGHSGTPLTDAEYKHFGITPNNVNPWIMKDGIPQQIGKTPPASTTVNLPGENQMAKSMGAALSGQLDSSYNIATSAKNMMNTVNSIRPTLQEEGSVYSGPFSVGEAWVDRVGEKLGVFDKDPAQRLQKTGEAIQGLAKLEMDASGAMKGQGPITENERLLIKNTAAGDLSKLDQATVVTLLNALDKQSNYRLNQHEKLLDRFKSAYKDDKEMLKQFSIFDIDRRTPAQIDADNLLGGKK